jgi:hypothetical protein
MELYHPPPVLPSENGRTSSLQSHQCECNRINVNEYLSNVGLLHASRPNKVKLSALLLWLELSEHEENYLWNP